MKLEVLMVSIKTLAKSFPDYHVSSINNYYDEGEKLHYIALVNQDFKTIYARLDSDGRINNAEELVRERNGIEIQS